jgi:hypothetical protein
MPAKHIHTATGTHLQAHFLHRAGKKNLALAKDWQIYNFQKTRG